MNHKYRINPDWKRLASRIVMPNHRVLVLGASDAGKSTFCRYLIDYACAASLKVAFVDADVGQSQIGPPTTIGMKLFEPKLNGADPHLPFGGPENGTTNQVNSGTESELTADTKQDRNDQLCHKADALYFVGGLSPQRNLLPILTGTRLMVDAGLNAGADFTVIDTTGYVHDGAAVALKQQKIDLIRPHHLVCLGRSKDLERIVGCYGDLDFLTIHYLLPHRLVRTKSGEARKKNRKVKFEAYFAGSELQTVSIEEIRSARTAFFNGRIANQKELEILTRLAEEEIMYAEWEHRSVSLIARRNLPQSATKNLKNYLSLSFVAAETPAYIEQRLVGMVNEEGETLAIGIIENMDFHNRNLNVRCEPDIASKIKVLQFGGYRFIEKQ
ncbi:MAG: Clp1/GlmU family protein [Candidatus Poribacteria bacterium]|nr:Clp1/GlmU family protein [Candidatus Poribacteria bacterium]